MALAYLLDPVASRLERLGLNRLTATLVIMLLFIVGTIVLVSFCVPIVFRELEYFVDDAPRYLKQLRELTTDSDRTWLGQIVAEGLSTVERSFGDLTSMAAGWFGEFLHSAWSGGEALLSVFSLLIVAPIVTCYLVYDWKKMMAVMDNWIPPTRRETVRILAREVDDTIAGFVRGQSALCLILGIFYALALALLGLNHGLLIGFAAGLISFVPYVGSMTGLVVATCVAIAQFWPQWGLIAVVPAIFLFGQSLGDYVLSPYLVGRRVNLNPVWMMFALFAFGYLFGFVGLLIAVPMAAAIGVLLRFATAQYYASPFYSVEPAASGMTDL